MKEYIDNGEEIIIVEDEQEMTSNNNKSKKGLSKKTRNIMLASGITLCIVAGGFALSKTQTFKNMRELRGCTIERVEAIPVAPNGSYLTYMEDEKGKQVLVCATDNITECYLAVDYVECEGFEIRQNLEDLKFYYELDGKRYREADPVVPEDYELVWVEDHGYMLHKDIVDTTYTVPSYDIPEGYALKEDKSGYYGIKIKSKTKQENAGNVIGTSSNR